MTDYYQTLGVAKNATPQDIKKAYRRLAGIHHPDKGGDTSKFQEIQTAYETLSDPKKRQEYDNPSSFGPFNDRHGFHFNFNGFNINDLFGAAFSQGFRQPQMPSYRTTVLVTLEQAYSGSEQTLQFNADGQRQVVKIQVPKGVTDGQTLRYENLIKNAILLVEFRIQPHPTFERDGSNLYSIQDIDVLDLIIGTEIRFTAISGKVLTVKVPPKTQPGAKLRIQNEGMPVNNGFGDQYILLKPFIPDKIDNRIIDSILQSRA
jgi:DnaJ-class molecular chaperone